MSKQWYLANTSNDQGLIADEQTGENIAVSYKKENASLIAASPDLLEAAKMVEEAYGCECVDEAPRNHCPMCILRAAIARAE